MPVISPLPPVNHNRLVRFLPVAVAAFILATAILGCHDSVGPSKDGRIVFLKSIERVQLGDDSSTVIEKLGRPSAIVPLRYPTYRFEYYQGLVANLNLTINIPPTRPAEWTGIAVFPPYSGKTNEGIGIGSLRSSVLQVFGPPSDHLQSSDSTSWDSFDDSKNMFIVSYVNERLRTISFDYKTLPSTRGGN